MRLFFVFVLIAFLGPSIGFADGDRNDSMKRFFRLFPDDSTIGDLGYFRHLPSYDVYDLKELPDHLGASGECRGAAEELIEMTTRYFRLASCSGLKGKAKKNYEQIHEYLFETIGESNPCFEKLASVYLISSLAGQDSSNSSFYSVLALILISVEKVKYLTPSRRQELGGIWNLKKKRRKNFEVLAGYDCLTSTIYVDPTSAPFDFAGGFVHEADHLFRDKFAPYDRTISVRDFLLIDEALAVLHAGILQRRISDGIHPYMKLWPFDLMKSKPYSVRDDRSLYAKKGDLHQIWESTKRSSYPQYTTVDEVLEQSFLRGSVSSPQVIVQGKRIALDSLIENVYRKVSEVYFGENHEPSLPSAVSIGMELSPLAQWVKEFPNKYNAGVANAAIRAGERSIFDDFSDLLDSLEEESLYCRDFRLAIDSGSLDDYFGNPISHEPSGKPGGSEGVRTTGDDGTKPGGSEGVRTEGDGEDDVKPTTDVPATLRPSLRSVHKI